jgi:hypothetical protein
MTDRTTWDKELVAGSEVGRALWSMDHWIVFTRNGIFKVKRPNNPTRILFSL